MSCRLDVIGLFEAKMDPDAHLSSLLRVWGDWSCSGSNRMLLIVSHTALRLEVLSSAQMSVCYEWNVQSLRERANYECARYMSVLTLT